MKIYNKKYKMIEVYSALVIDLIALLFAYVGACHLRTLISWGAEVTDRSIWLPGLAMAIVGCVLYNTMSGKYHHFFRRGYYDELIEVMKYDIFQFAFISACLYVLHISGDFPRLTQGYFLVLNLLLSYLFRVLFKRYMRIHYRSGKGSDKVLIVTTADMVQTILDNIKKDASWSYEIIGLVIVDQQMTGEEIDGFRVVAGEEQLLDVARQMPLDLVFFYCPGWHKKVETWIQACLVMGLRCDNCVQRFSFETPYTGIDQFADFPVLTYCMNKTDYRMMIIKRAMDIVGGLVGLIITGIVTPFVALAIKLEDPKGKVFFGQIRIGKNGRRFKIYKFRSMYADAEERKKELMAKNEMQGLMFKMKDDPRITKVGKFIRKTSIDELPQFWNIFKGDMSLVGTRPPTVEEFEKYNDYYRRRLSITPGLTGMWQVSGRSDITDFDEVVKLDLQYIDNWCIRKDIKILLQTVYVVLFGKGSK